MRIKVRFAFTLAEVLIALAIIGVVVSMTIPNLLTNVGNKQLTTKLTKIYGELRQVVNYNLLDYSSHATLRDSFGAKFDFVRTGTMNEIFPAEYKVLPNTSQNVGWNSTTSTHASAQMADGTLIRFYSYGNSCASTSGTLTNICANIIVDVNGIESPNRLGRDFFRFWIVKRNEGYSLIPFGVPEDPYKCTKSTSTTNNYGCAYTVLFEPSKLPY